MTSSRFVAEFASVKKAEAAVSRFLVCHPKLSRFIAQIPGASKFLPPPVARSRLSAEASSKVDGAAGPAVATVPHVAPVYNSRALKPRGPQFRL